MIYKQHAQQKNKDNSHQREYESLLNKIEFSSQTENLVKNMNLDHTYLYDVLTIFI